MFMSNLVDTVDYVDKLALNSLSHRALNHPYLDALASGDLPNPGYALADFANQYSAYSCYFSKYLAALISKLEDIEDATYSILLLKNLAEESGNISTENKSILGELGIQVDWVEGVPHSELFSRFRNAMLASHPLDPQHIETDVNVLAWRRTLHSIILQGSPAEGVGVLGLGTEGIIQYIYRTILTAIEAHSDLHPSEYVFFTLHYQVDDSHQTTLLNIAKELATTEVAKHDMLIGMTQALNLRASFWDLMYERALRMTWK